MEGLIFILLFLALAIGYGLGRRPWRKDTNTGGHARYIEGVRQLIEEQHDAALDTFINALDVNATNFETHLAFGALWRRRGEGDRAIRIHQNMLEQPGLSPGQLHQVQFELALDYSKSGLLDRAEVLLQALTDTPVPEIRHQAFQELVYLYQDEREWEKAIQRAESLCGEARPGEIGFWRHLQAHYCCELAEQSLAKMGLPSSNSDPSGIDAVKERLAQARRFVPAHNRVLLLQAQMEINQGNAGGALDALRHLQMEEQYLMIALPILIQVHERAGKVQDLEVLVADIYHRLRSPPMIPVLGDLIFESRGNYAAFEFVEKELRGCEPLFLAELLSLLDKNIASFAQLKPILQRALPLLFHCEACGFEGKQFYWCCPTCKHWI